MSRPGGQTFFLGLISGVIATAGLFLASAWFGYWPVDAESDPPRWELAIARHAFSVSVSRQGPHAQNPIPPTDQNLLEGLKVFRSGCAGCHGDNGKPSNWGSRHFYPRAPQFAQTPPEKPDWQIFWIVKKGVRYSGMGGWEEEASDDSLWKVATFLSRLKSLPPEVAAEWSKPGS